MKRNLKVYDLTNHRSSDSNDRLAKCRHFNKQVKQVSKGNSHFFKMFQGPDSHPWNWKSGP